METVTPWSVDEPVRSPFALPAGPAGRLAGRLMLLINKQQDIVDLLDVQPDDRVLEVGYGPGALIRLLRPTGAGRICGVDPSSDMRALASRAVRPEIAAGRIDLRSGRADHTGFPEAEFDRVVSVNNVAIWPDLEAGLRELARVTRPGGRILLAWHGGTRPSRIARHMALPEGKLARIERGLAELCAEVTRGELAKLTTFTAVR
jgi:SAM-dependent methyltransferase